MAQNCNVDINTGIDVFNFFFIKVNNYGNKKMNTYFLKVGFKMLGTK